MQQNLLLYCMHIQRDLFGGLASILGCPRAFSRLPTLEDWPFWPLRGLKGQISRLAASLRPRQPKISARQPKKSCCLCIQCNKRPLFAGHSFSRVTVVCNFMANEYPWIISKPLIVSINQITITYWIVFWNCSQIVRRNWIFINSLMLAPFLST